MSLQPDEDGFAGRNELFHGPVLVHGPQFRYPCVKSTAMSTPTCRALSAALHTPQLGGPRWRRGQNSIPPPHYFELSLPKQSFNPKL